MNTEYNLNITNDVKNHFENILHGSNKMDESKIIKAVENTLSELKNTTLEDYVFNHIKPLEQLLELLLDKNWKTSESDRNYILSALQYFAEEEDIIPDNIPVVGLLDDCIVIDIVTEKLKQELKDHKDFMIATKVYSNNNNNFSFEDWQITKKKELFSRIRHRRLRGNKSRFCRGTGFSLG